MALLEVFSGVALTISQVMDIPPEYQLPLAAAAVIVLGLIMYGAGIISVNEKGSVVVGSPQKSVAFNSPGTPGSPPSTPKRSKRGNEALGTVTTPAGRRSARLARTRKED